MNMAKYATSRNRERRVQRVALYARVSTAAGQDPEMQLRELREYIERRGWENAGAYVDKGISGAKENRPELDRLMADLLPVPEPFLQGRKRSPRGNGTAVCWFPQPVAAQARIPPTFRQNHH